MSEDYQLAVMLKEGPRRQEVLRVIGESYMPVSSDDISRKIRMPQSNVIRILRELERKGAVQEVTGRRRNRRYKITAKGKEALIAKEKF